MIVMLSLIIPPGIDGDEITGMTIRGSTPFVYKERCISRGIPLTSSNGMISIGSLHYTRTHSDSMNVLSIKKRDKERGTAVSYTFSNSLST
jgi:hypothetical protein